MKEDEVLLNGRVHQVCGTCGAVVGHGCPCGEACDECEED